MMRLLIVKWLRDLSMKVTLKLNRVYCKLEYEALPKSFESFEVL